MKVRFNNQFYGIEFAFTLLMTLNLDSNTSAQSTCVDSEGAPVCVQRSIEGEGASSLYMTALQCGHEEILTTFNSISCNIPVSETIGPFNCSSLAGQDLGQFCQMNAMVGNDPSGLSAAAACAESFDQKCQSSLLCNTPQCPRCPLDPRVICNGRSSRSTHFDTTRFPVPKFKGEVTGIGGGSCSVKCTSTNLTAYTLGGDCICTRACGTCAQW